MASSSPLDLYWWSPVRQLSELQWQVRSEWRSWIGMHRYGGLGIRNFGDELSQRVLEHATGRQIKWGSPEKADVYGIGSILEKRIQAGGNGLIWGSGLRNGGSPPHRPEDSAFLAVRGHLTRQALDLPADLPLGDPGLIARSIYAKRVKDLDVVLLPHFTVFGSKSGRALIEQAQQAGMKIIAPATHVDEVCETIGRAQLVLTSSLHGQIVAHALETPVILVDFEMNVEPGFKYHDYMSVFGLPSHSHAMRDLLGDGLARAKETATEENATISPQVNPLVAGLIDVAQKLN